MAKSEKKVRKYEPHISFFVYIAFSFFLIIFFLYNPYTIWLIIYAFIDNPDSRIYDIICYCIESS